MSAAWLTADAISPSRTSIGPGFPAGKDWLSSQAMCHAASAAVSASWRLRLMAGTSVTATLIRSVPTAFFELDWTKPVYGDAEALLSGEGGRGVQTVEKSYLHTPDSSSVLMVDDVPTEARLHPAGWQPLPELKGVK